MRVSDCGEPIGKAFSQVERCVRMGLGGNATKLVFRAEDSQRCRIGGSLRIVLLPFSAQLSGCVLVSGFSTPRGLRP
jgi:hypothetical protein